MNLPIFERLGVMDKVRALGVFKPGADFEADTASGYHTFEFARALGPSPPHAYQVWRQDFDRMLFEHARQSGADTREGHEVIASDQAGPRLTRLEVRTDIGGSYGIEARYLVDASGRDAFLSVEARNCAARTASIRARRYSGTFAVRQRGRARTLAISASTALSTAGCG